MGPNESPPRAGGDRVEAADVSTPDDRSWLGSGVGRSAPGRLRVYCSEPVHEGNRLPIRDLRRDVGGWFVNPDLDTLRDDPTPIANLADGTPLNYRVRIILRCGCGLNLPLVGEGADERAVHVLDMLADNGVSEIGLRRLCGLVSNWRT